MTISFKKLALFGILSVFFLRGSPAQDNPAADPHSTGLIPLDAKQVDEIVKSWPRINKVNINWLGFERVNKNKAKKGITPLASYVVKPVGQEVESSIWAPGASVQSIAMNPELVGALPASVDNSTLKYFPPIRNQGNLNSCVSFATTYTQLSYMSAFEQDLDIRDNLDNTNKFSPKWTYNMVNGGANAGTLFSNNYALLEKHGACTWAEFPYDSDYRAWCLGTNNWMANPWMKALNVRTNPTQYVYSVHTDSGLEQIKELITNGYILVFGTYISSWQYRYVQDDPSTPDDDSEVGKYVGYWLYGAAGAHAMTIVGYNEAIWTDVNGNGVIDPGEKGAFKIANSWGTDWADGGFIWLAYDALRGVSAIPDGPSAGRVGAFQGNMAFVLTVRGKQRLPYCPLMIAVFTVNHAKRNQLRMNLGYSDTWYTIPSTVWTPGAIQNQGGAYAFDGSTTAIDATFVFDFSDLVSPTGPALRYYLGMNDNSWDWSEAALSAFKIIDLTTDPYTEIPSSLVPRYVDLGQVYAYVDYSYSGPNYDDPPTLSDYIVMPTIGTTLDSYSFWVWYYDEAGSTNSGTPRVKNLYIDGNPHPMVLHSGYPAYDGWYYFNTGLSAGSHDFRFYFESGHGIPVRDPIAGTHSGPIVTFPHFVSQPNIPSGELHPALGSYYTYSIGGSSCNLGHDIQYRFDWGDSSISDWLPVGQTSTAHSWSSSESYRIKAQARCTADTAIESSWSDALVAGARATVPFMEAFSTSVFPAGWIQQKVGDGIFSLWSVSGWSNAGGQPYEMRCTFWNTNPGTSRLVTPPLNTIGFSTLRLRFKHYLDTWDTGGVQLKIQTSPDGWNWTDEAWTVTTSSSNIGPATVDTILTHNLNNSTTYVGFVVKGNLYMFDDWYIDDVSISRAVAKSDFNGDGQEDILWRYYGSGGWNRAWFLGGTGIAPQPLSIGDTQMEAGPAGSKLIRNRASKKVIMDPRDMGMISKRTNRPPMKDPQDVMGSVKRRDTGLATVDDPRKAGRIDSESSLLASPISFADPREAKLALNTQTLSDNLAEVAATKPLLGGADVLPVGDLNWQIRGTGDFNGDGNVDILWRYNGPGGSNVVWFMDGTNWIGSAGLIPVADLNWQIVGTGDFNQDGDVDILWRYNGPGGYNVVWYMNGTNWIGSAELITVSDLNWQIVGTGDFNKDSYVDILWRYNGAGGSNFIWYMNGTNWIGGGNLLSVADLNWQIVGTGDYNNDGNIDILWRYNGTGGYVYIWYLEGVTWIGGDDLLPVADLTWKIVSR